MSHALNGGCQLTTKHPKPPQPAEFPYKLPRSLPWGGDDMVQCPCPGNPNLMCDCLSIQVRRRVASVARAPRPVGALRG